MQTVVEKEQKFSRVTDGILSPKPTYCYTIMPCGHKSILALNRTSQQWFGGFTEKKLIIAPVPITIHVTLLPIKSLGNPTHDMYKGVRLGAPARPTNNSMLDSLWYGPHASDMNYQPHPFLSPELPPPLSIQLRQHWFGLNTSVGTFPQKLPALSPTLPKRVRHVHCWLIFGAVRWRCSN
jgi:hypothetical protein